MGVQVNLKKLAEDTAERYLKSVIVIDNEIFPGRENEVHPLAGLPLTKAFAQKGIACAMYNPEEGDENIVATCVSLISQTDAAIVDWQLGRRGADGNEDPSIKCREIVDTVLKKDKEAGKPLRLLLIYTGEDQLDPLRDQLHNYLADLGHPELRRLDENEELLGLAGGNARIVFARKTRERENLRDLAPEDTVGPTELPDKLINQFSRLADGILPMVALNAVAAVREHSHTLLSFFDKELDAAFVYHAATIPDSRDCTAFLLEQIRDEVHTIIEADRATKKCTGIGTLRAWYSQHKVFVNKKDIELKPEDAQQLIVAEYIGTKTCKDVPNRKLHEIYKDNEKLCRFSCIANIRREAGGRHRTILTDYRPVLTQGTLVQSLKNKHFLLCIMPRCDSVRLNDDPAVFPFVIVDQCNASRSPHLCCRYDGEARSFTLPKKLEWKEINLMKFPAKGGTVTARRDHGRYVFKSKDGGHFRWVADLKDLFMTMLMADLAPNLSRIGIDEYEWLRKNRSA